jgi:hypothetical protein
VQITKINNILITQPSANFVAQMVKSAKIKLITINSFLYLKINDSCKHFLSKFGDTRSLASSFS